MRNRHIRRAVGWFLAGLTAGPALAAEGLSLPDPKAVWPQWQARINVSSARWTPPALGSVLSQGVAPGAVQSGAVLGDYYFDAPGLRLPQSLGGLRASSGLLFGPRGLAQTAGASLRHDGPRFGLSMQHLSAAQAGDPGASDAVPYLGLGYTGLALKGSFSITADLGLVAERSEGLGRALLGTQGLERSLRELRLSPVLQVGVSYAF